MHTHSHPHIHNNIHTYVYVCMCVYIYIIYIYIHTHTFRFNDDWISILHYFILFTLQACFMRDRFDAASLKKPIYEPT